MGGARPSTGWMNPVTESRTRCSVAAPTSLRAAAENNASNSMAGITCRHVWTDAPLGVMHFGILRDKPEASTASGVACKSSVAEITGKKRTSTQPSANSGRCRSCRFALRLHWRIQMPRAPAAMTSQKVFSRSSISCAAVSGVNCTSPVEVQQVEQTQVT